MFQNWFEVNSDTLDEVVAAVVGLFDISRLNDTDVELVYVWEKSLVDSLLELGDIFLISQLSDDGETSVLDIEDGLIDSFNVMF